MKIRFLLPILLLTTACFAQTAESMDLRAQQLFAATNNMDLQKIVDLTYNKVFTIVDKQTLINAMKSMFNNDFMKVQITNPLPAKYQSDPIKTIDGKKFCVIRYHNSMKMILVQPVDDASIAQMIEGMKAASHYDSVTFDKNANAFLIEGSAVMIAVADGSTQNQWEFVNYDNKEMFNAIFDEKIKTELGLN